MLADAFAAERLRLSKAWGVLFWTMLFAPLVSIIIGLGGAAMTRTAMGKMGADIARQHMPPIDLGRSMIEAMAASDLIPVQMLFMIGAAAIFAGDYRWETWRLLTPRNTRTNLILGKMSTFALVAAVGLGLLALGGLVSALLNLALTGLPLRSAQDLGAVATQLAGGFITSWLELIAIAGVAACVAIFTRNGVAAILAPVAIWLVQLPIIQKVSGGPGETPLYWLAALPALCADTMRVAIASGAARPPETPFALLFLLAWIAGLSALAVWLFKRQDLTRE